MAIALVNAGCSSSWTCDALAETAGLHTNSIRYLERQDHITPAYSTEQVINALHHHGVEFFLQPSWGVRLR